MPGMSGSYVQPFGLSLGQTPDGEAFVVFDPRGGAHQLNNSALFVLDCCAEPRTVAELAEEAQREFGLADPPTELVEQALRDLAVLGLVLDAATIPPPSGPQPSTADLAVQAAPAIGRGVYALRPFAAGEVIERCPVVVVSAEESRTIQRTTLGRYTYFWGDDEAAVALGFGSLYNHSDDPNAVTRRLEHELLIELVALRPIAVGEEICHNYGDAVKGYGFQPLPS